MFSTYMDKIQIYTNAKNAKIQENRNTKKSKNTESSARRKLEKHPVQSFLT